MPQCKATVTNISCCAYHLSTMYACTYYIQLAMECYASVCGSVVKYGTLKWPHYWHIIPAGLIAQVLKFEYDESYIIDLYYKSVMDHRPLQLKLKVVM